MNRIYPSLPAQRHFQAALLIALLLPVVGLADTSKSDSELRYEWNTIQTSKDREIQRQWWQRISPRQLRRFLRAGVRVNLSDKRGWTPLHSAVRFSSDVGVVEELLDAGARVAATNRSGDTSLHWAARANPDVRFTMTLIKAGADVNARDKFGWSAVHTAAESNPNPDIIATLLDAGAEPKKRAYFLLFGPVFLVKHNENMSKRDKEAAIRLLKAAG